jgi:prepilin-type processing-associated H-X9-DG protein
VTGLTNRRYRRGFTIRDLAVTVTCLLVAAGMLASLTGATRDLSQVQVCASNLRQLYTGLAAYVAQYNSYPPHAPYPTYMASETINGISTYGWDPNIGFIMTHGLGLTPPRTDTAGHFIWYGTLYADLPDVCKCPAMSPALLDPTNPEVDTGSRETSLYQYTLSYQTSGTCRAATPVIRAGVGVTPSLGGRNPPIPDPTRGDASGHPADNAQYGTPYVWTSQHTGAPDVNYDSGGLEVSCWIQAIHPAEVQSPGRTYYLSDSRDYRPIPGGWPAAGKNSGWGGGYGNKLFLGTRHFQYANVLYLDGRVTRDNQTHPATWNLVYTGDPNDVRSGQWRAATFNTDIRLAMIDTQVYIMPVLMVKGWEYFFDATGVKAQ